MPECPLGPSCVRECDPVEAETLRLTREAVAHHGRHVLPYELTELSGDGAGV